MLEGIAGVIVALSTAAGAIGALILTIRNGRRQSEAKAAAVVAARAAEDAKNEITVINGQIRQLGIAVDGRLSKLIEEIEKRSFAEGKAEGKNEERNRPVTPDAAGPVDVKIVGTKGHVPVVVKEPKGER